MGRREGFYCLPYEEEFSYVAKYDEVSGVAIAPDTGVILYPHNESCYFPVDELPCWCGDENCPSNIRHRAYMRSKRKKEI